MEASWKILAFIVYISPEYLDNVNAVSTALVGIYRYTHYELEYYQLYSI
jgi:hypothetical protein